MAIGETTLTKMAPGVAELLNKIEPEMPAVSSALNPIYTLPTKLKNITYNSMKYACPGAYWGLEVLLDHQYSDDRNRGLLAAVGAGSAKFTIGMGESWLIGATAAAAGISSLPVAAVVIGGSLISECGSDMAEQYAKEWQQFPGFPQGATLSEKQRIYQDYKDTHPYANPELMSDAILFQTFFKAISPQRIYDGMWSLFSKDNVDSIEHKIEETSVTKTRPIDYQRFFKPAPTTEAPKINDYGNKLNLRR
jgi:hypothetical protein